MKPNHKKAAKYYRENFKLAMGRVDTLEEERSGLFEKCEILQAEKNSISEECCNLLLKVKELIEENERLRKALCTDISVVRVSRGSGKTAHLREIGRIKVDAIRADTVRKMQERLKALLKTDYINGTREHALSVIDQIAKEMLEEDT